MFSVSLLNKSGIEIGYIKTEDPNCFFGFFQQRSQYMVGGPKEPFFLNRWIITPCIAKGSLTDFLFPFLKAAKIVKINDIGMRILFSIVKNLTLDILTLPLRLIVYMTWDTIEKQLVMQDPLSRLTADLQGSSKKELVCTIVTQWSHIRGDQNNTVVMREQNQWLFPDSRISFEETADFSNLFGGKIKDLAAEKPSQHSFWRAAIPEIQKIAKSFCLSVQPFDPLSVLTSDNLFQDT